MTEVAVPPEYWGLWRRYSLALGNAPAIEPALVFWCQAPRLFMDMRWRIDPPDPDGLGLSVDRMMAGFTTYESEGFMTWHHQVDSLVGEGSDRSAVRVTADELVEEGDLSNHNDPPRPFVEIWRRVSTDTPTITQIANEAGESFTADAGGWHMELIVPRSAGQPGEALLTHRGGVNWTLGGTFVEVGGDS